MAAGSGTSASSFVEEDVGTQRVVVQGAAFAKENAPQKAQAGQGQREHHDKKTHASDKRAGSFTARGDHAHAEQTLSQGLAQYAAQIDLVERTEAEKQTERARRHGIAIEQTRHDKVGAKLLGRRKVDAEHQSGAYCHRHGYRQDQRQVYEGSQYSPGKTRGPHTHHLRLAA